MSPKKPKNEKELKAQREKADRLTRKGDAYLRSADLAAAKACFEEALEAYAPDQDSPGAAACCLKLGRTVELLGEYGKAHTQYRQALDRFSRLEDTSGMARANAYLGNIAWAQGDYADAAGLFEVALTHFKGVGDLLGRAWIMDLQANLLLAQGKFQEAENLHRAAYALAQEAGENPEGRAWNDFHLADIDLDRGNRDAAQKGFLSALGLFTGLKDVLGIVATCVHLGEIACEMRDDVEAGKYILKALRLVVPTGCKPLLADAMTGLARLLMVRGQNDQALGILMFVLSHPNCRRQTKDRMVSLAKALEANFSPKEIEMGFGWAKHFTMEEMAAAWVKKLSGGDAPPAKGRKKPKS